MQIIHLGIFRDVIPRRQAMAVRISVRKFYEVLNVEGFGNMLPTQPGQNPTKIGNYIFHTKITLQPYRPTGHCPNARMASPPSEEEMRHWTPTGVAPRAYDDDDDDDDDD